MTDNQLLQLLHKPLGLSAKASLYRCPAGAVNHVYHLLDANLSAAVKWLGDDNFSGVKRREQFVLQQSLSRLGAAPEPIWLSADETIWVEQWIDCDANQIKQDNNAQESSVQKNDKQANSQPEALTPQQMAQVLAQLHALPVSGHPLNLYERWQHYLEVANITSTSALFDKVCELKHHVINSERTFSDGSDAENRHNDNVTESDIVICHNDLLRAHVLKATAIPPLLIDWEYAAIGNRYFDLASCCLINGFTEAESAQLVNTYADEMNICPQRALSQYKLFTDIVDVTNALWRAAMDATANNETLLNENSTH
ncbi:phosphotransferase [Alteromonas sp. BMJM2]|uniref:phosphotransferase n=1 Tax=Alteromonas sp. BMJM2 TaxID=2954241 RepID=UPI0022B41A11|nr:phosphotransferase [Alteromonas sp. BMJM2]